MCSKKYFIKILNSIILLFSIVLLPNAQDLKSKKLIDEEKIEIIRQIARQWVPIAEHQAEAFNKIITALQNISEVKLDTQVVMHAVFGAYERVSVDIEDILIKEMYSQFDQKELKSILEFESSEVGKKYRAFSKMYSSGEDLQRVYNNVVEYIFEELTPVINELKLQKLKNLKLEL